MTHPLHGTSATERTRDTFNVLEYIAAQCDAFEDKAANDRARGWRFDEADALNLIRYIRHALAGPRALPERAITTQPAAE